MRHKKQQKQVKTEETLFTLDALVDRIDIEEVYHEQEQIELQ